MGFLHSMFAGNGPFTTVLVCARVEEECFLPSPRESSQFFRYPLFPPSYPLPPAPRAAPRPSRLVCYGVASSTFASSSRGTGATLATATVPYNHPDPLLLPSYAPPPLCLRKAKFPMRLTLHSVPSVGLTLPKYGENEFIGLFLTASTCLARRTRRLRHFKS